MWHLTCHIKYLCCVLRLTSHFCDGIELQVSCSLSLSSPQASICASLRTPTEWRPPTPCSSDNPSSTTSRRSRPSPRLWRRGSPSLYPAKLLTDGQNPPFTGWFRWDDDQLSMIYKCPSVWKMTQYKMVHSAQHHQREIEMLQITSDNMIMELWDVCVSFNSIYHEIMQCIVEISCQIIWNFSSHISSKIKWKNIIFTPRIFSLKLGKILQSWEICNFTSCVYRKISNFAKFLLLNTEDKMLPYIFSSCDLYFLKIFSYCRSTLSEKCWQ